MPIPALDEEGFLPPGVHECDLGEIKERFGQFRGSDRRAKLCAKLKDFVAELQRTGLAEWLIVNGSFATAKSEPEDIDLVVVLPAAHDFASDLLPDAYNFVSRNRVARRYGFDIFVAADGTPLFFRYVAYFQEIKRRTDRRKGVLRMRL